MPQCILTRYDIEITHLKGEEKMLGKHEIKRQIAESEKEIEELEKKRMRSHCAIMEANLNNVPPDPYDVEYFKVFSNLIELERKNLRQLKAELAKK